MQTIRLFYKDPYQTQFEAVVAETRAYKGKFQVRLTQTCFYPEGGGQPYDTGTLNDIAVTEVHESDGEIWHTVAAPIKVGETVHGQIDWERRFDLMQQHSGEHIISGILHEMTGAAGPDLRRCVLAAAWVFRRSSGSEHSRQKGRAEWTQCRKCWKCTNSSW